MVKIHLARLLREKRMSKHELYLISDVRYNTITAYCNRKVKRVNLRDLEKICDVLECTLSELIEYTPNLNKKL